eukprot:gb/GEZJ01007135.1/.p1 GENE.gb/GEZJ01007135.1/~~gb/GEZJ01007135.1/.p1  ORF type:complete len:115 (-),score=0.41 gb/GEZJ01007135.1/:77-421(-)
MRYEVVALWRWWSLWSGISAMQKRSCLCLVLGSCLDHMHVCAVFGQSASLCDVSYVRRVWPPVDLSVKISRYGRTGYIRFRTCQCCRGVGFIGDLHHRSSPGSTLQGGACGLSC